MDKLAEIYFALALETEKAGDMVEAAKLLDSAINAEAGGGTNMDRSLKRWI